MIIAIKKARKIEGRKEEERVEDEGERAANFRRVEIYANHRPSPSFFPPSCFLFPSFTRPLPLLPPLSLSSISSRSRHAVVVVSIAAFAASTYTQRYCAPSNKPLILLLPLQKSLISSLLIICLNKEEKEPPLHQLAGCVWMCVRVRCACSTTTTTSRK